MQAEMCSDSFQLLGMAERGFLPAVLAKRSRYGTPTLAILLSSLGILMLVTFDFLQVCLHHCASWMLLLRVTRSLLVSLLCCCSRRVISHRVTDADRRVAEYHLLLGGAAGVCGLHTVAHHGPRHEEACSCKTAAPF